MKLVELPRLMLVDIGDRGARFLPDLNGKNRAEEICRK
jgi:hypothetical protein